MPEVRRLVLLVVEPESAARAHHLHWSAWRRRHQAVARQGHQARRAHRPPPAQPGSATPGPIPIVAVPGTAQLSEGLWQQIAPLLAPAPWRDVPPTCGPWQTIYARYALWVRTGLWERIAAILHPDLAAPEPAVPP